MNATRKNILLTEPDGNKRLFPCLTDLCRIINQDIKAGAKDCKLFSYHYLKNRPEFPYTYKKHTFERIFVEK